MQIKVVENQNEVYIKQKLLGEGAFGKAYLVKHKQSGESLVIKQMNIQHMSTKQKQQTIKQAQILKNLNHPNIVLFKQVYITKNNKLKIVMEYAECGDLAKAIHSRKAKKQYFQEPNVLDWFTQICLAIKHVHDRKILHRDIKGQNIFISKNNSLKLGDFGIARVLKQTMEKARTVVGTPYYLSPQIIENKPYSFQSDIWSIGAVLYQMCALQPPFTATSLQMLALKIVKGSYPPVPGNYSKQLKNLISQMLTLNPSKRPNINDILKKPIIQDRIKKFLSETKRVAQFSHTILHNQKVQIFTNKLVQIKQEKLKSASQQKNSNQDFDRQREKLKNQQIRMEAILQKKKEKEKQDERRRINEKKKYEEKKKLEEAQRREFEIKKREQQKNFQEQQRRKWVQKQREKQRAQRDREYEDNRRMAQMHKNRRSQQQKQYERQMQIQSLMMKKHEIEERARKQNQDKKKKNKMFEQQKKKQDFNDAARRQFFENQQIRKMAQQRAKRDQQGYYQQPQPVVEQVPQIKNYHYEKQRPSSKNEGRPSSREKKTNYSDYYQKDKRYSGQPSSEQIENAYLNPNFNKKRASMQKKSAERRPSSQQQQRKPSSGTKQPQNPGESRKKIEDGRQKMRKDRQKFMKNKNRNDDDDRQYQQQEDIQKQDSIKDIKDRTKIGKWGNKKKSENDSQQKSPRFPNQDEISSSPQKQYSPDKQKGFDTLIRDSQNLFLQAHNPAQFDNYIVELEGILNDVQKKIELLPEIPYHQEIMFRQDDQLEFSLTADNGQIKIDKDQLETEDADLQYFSNFSKLETLRIQLEEAFGLDNFIRLYRYIQSQVGQHGLESFNIVEAVKEAGGDIDSKVLKKNLTLLLTLVTMQQNMNQN